MRGMKVLCLEAYMCGSALMISINGLGRCLEYHRLDTCDGRVQTQ
jgi:hypothetical protein